MRRETLLRSLIADGSLRDPAWQDAFFAVPRELFVPYYLTTTFGGEERRWRYDPDPGARERWLDGVYEDAPLAIRLRDGQLLSSSSQPSLMAGMLEALQVRDGMSVLEIGTGSGWNAGLLCHRLGEDRVTTVDLDPDITDAARAHLAEAGYRPTIVTGDGARGYGPSAPYDRVIATCSLRSVPVAWVEQTVPGGLILAPLTTGLIALRVQEGGWGEGRFLSTPAFFVPLRGSGELAEPPPRPDGVPANAVMHDSFRFLLALSADGLKPREAYEMWRAENRPARERFGLTVTASGQWAWLDNPDGTYRWKLGAD